jgi:hypothetical protein
MAVVHMGAMIAEMEFKSQFLTNVWEGETVVDN